MFTLSAAAAAALQTSHSVAWQVDCLLNGHVVFSAQNNFLESGSVSADITAASRRSVNCTLIDPANQISPFLDIYGQELRVWRGVYLPGGGAELQPLGTFGLTDVQKLKDPGLSVKIRGMDRAEAIRVRSFTDTYSIAAGTNVGQAIQSMLTFIIPWLPFTPTDFSTLTAATTPLIVYNEGNDAWAEAVKLAAAIGMDLFFDPLGNCVLRPVPSVGTSPVVWSFIEGVNCTAPTIGARGVASEAYSGALVIGEGTGIPAGATPPRALVWDTDSTSPTYYLGAFGKRARVIRSPLVTTQQQAVDYATAEMRLTAGSAKRVEFTAVPNGALDPGDVIHVTTTEFDEIHVLQNFVVPFKESELLNAGSRRRTLA